MIDINDYRVIYKQNIIGITRIWFCILIFIIIGIFVINKSFKYISYYTNVGEAKDEYFNVYVLIDDLAKIIENQKIIIENEEFAYKIKEISEENIYLNNNYYKEVKLSIAKKMDENMVINFKIIDNEQTILEYVFETVWR